MRELIEKNSRQVLDAAPALLQALFSLPDPPPLPFAKSCLTVGLEALTAPSEARTLYAHLIEMQRPLSPQSAVRFFQLLEGQLITSSEFTGSSFASILDWLEWRSSCGDALLALLDYIEEARREASRLTELHPLSPPLHALLHRRGMISPSVRESLLHRLGPFYERRSDQRRFLLLLLRESEAAPWPWVLPTVAATLSGQRALVTISLRGQRHLPQATLRSLARHLLALPAGRAPDEKTLRHRLDWITSRCPEGRAQLYTGWPLLLWWLGEGERPSQVMYMGVAGRQRLLFDALFVLVRAAARDTENRLLFMVEETQWMSELEWAFFHQLRLSLGKDVSCACLFSVPESDQGSVPEWLSLQSEVEWWDWEAKDTEPPLTRLLGAPADPALDRLSESAPHEGALFELLCTLALEGWIKLIDGQWKLQRALPPEPFKAIELLWGAALRGLPEGALLCLERLRELEGMLLDRASIERFVDSGGLGQIRRLEEAGWCRWVEAPGGGAFQFISGSLQSALHKLSSRRQRRAEECVATFAQWRHRVGFSPFLASAYYRAGELAQAARLWLAAIDRMLWFGDQDAARLLCDLASLAVDALPREEQHAARTSLHWGQLRVARRSGALHELTQGVSETMAAQLASAEFFIQRGELIQAEQLLSTLLAFSLRGGSDWCRVRGLFALCCYQRGAYEEAELFLEESVKVNLSGLSLSNQARLLHLRGRVAAARGQRALTLRALLDAWRIAQSCGDWELSAGILQSLGLYYFETGTSEGLLLLERSQQLLCYASPARIASGEVELGRAYLQIGAFEKALGFLRRAETSFALFSMHDEQAESRCLLGELSIELNQWSEATNFFSQGLAQASDLILKRRMQVGLGLARLGQGCVGGESSGLQSVERCAEELCQEAQGFQLTQALLLWLWVRRAQQRTVTDRERARWRADITERSAKSVRTGSVDIQLWEALCEAELALSAGDHMSVEIALEEAASALKYRHARLDDAGKLQSAQRWLERAIRVARAQLEGVPTPPHPILGAVQS